MKLTQDMGILESQTSNTSESFFSLCAVDASKYWMQARAHKVKLSIYLVESNLQENALNMHCIYQALLEGQ